LKACYGVPKSGQPSRTSETVGDANGTGADVGRSEWLIGEKLDKALSEEPDAIEVRWPFQCAGGDDKPDWEGRLFVL